MVYKYFLVKLTPVGISRIASSLAQNERRDNRFVFFGPRP